MPEALLRQCAMLRAIPRQPQGIDAVALKARLFDEGFNVTLRTVQRDLEALSSIFPLTCDTGTRPYAWAWERGAVHDMPGMDPSTALTFVLSDELLRPLLPRTSLTHLEPHFAQARVTLDQLSATSGLRTWRERVRVLPRGLRLRRAEIPADVLDVVYDALLRERRFEADYSARQTGDTKRYQVSPLGLVVRDSVTYLVATLRDYADIRQLALHRFSNPEPTDLSLNRPAGFDLDAYIAQGAMGVSTGDMPVDLVALFDAEAAEHLAETPLGDNQRLTPQDDGRMRVEASVPDNRELRWWLQGFGAQVEVLAPTSLREEFLHMARTLTERYITD